MIPRGWSRFQLLWGAVLASSSGLLLVVILENLLTTARFWLRSFVLVGHIVFGVLALAGIVWGCVTMRSRDRKGVLFANLALLMLGIAAPPLLEGLLRLGIAFGPEFFRQPSLYAHPHSDVEYFKLEATWHPSSREHPRAANLPELKRDARLGWSYPRTPTNPLGVLASIPYELGGEGRPVLFYGDSYVENGAQLEDKIPQLLDAELAELRVYNYGVRGYGLDQIYLRFLESHRLFRNPLILFGVFVEDLDRCLLDFRNAPKPFFRVENEELILSGMPLAPSVEAYLRAHPPRTRSYFLAALVRGVRYFRAGGSSFRDPYRRKEMEAIGAKILGAAVRESRRWNLSMVFVLFSPRSGGGWRREFFLEQLHRLDVAVLDVEEILKRAEMRAGRTRADSFDETGHHSLWANRMIAKAIAAYLEPLVKGGRAPVQESRPRLSDRATAPSRSG
ncbi:MAG: hypothetical protein ACE5FG_14410 [Myxococcota bacterium]